MNRAPKVGVVVVNFNARKKTIQCLESLMASDFTNLRIYVVENRSPNPAKAITHSDLRGFPETILRTSTHNTGFAGGVNIGIKDALEENCDYVFVLNNDSIVDKYCISQLVQSAQERHMAACVSPTILDLDVPNSIRFAGGRIASLTKSHKYHREPPKSAKGKDYETQLCSGAAMLIKSEPLRDVGLFDESLFLQSEDSDLCLRLQESGYSLIVNRNARVWHEIGGSCGTKTSPVSIFFATRNFFIVTRKHFSLSETRLAVFLFGAYTVPSTLVAFVLTNRFHLIRPFILGILWHIGINREMSNEDLVQRLWRESSTNTRITRSND